MIATLDLSICIIAAIQPLNYVGYINKYYNDFFCLFLRYQKNIEVLSILTPLHCDRQVKAAALGSSYYRRGER